MFGEAYSQADRHHAFSTAHSLELARRESTRDISAQKSQRVQGLMLSNTLLLGVWFSFVVEGIVPEETSSLLVMVYSLSLACGFTALFLSVWFAMKLQSRMTKYNVADITQVYTCGSIHPSFRGYYRCHCLTLNSLSIGSFYSGTISLIVAACVLTYTRFALTFGSPAAGTVFVIACALTVIALLVLGFVFPTSTRLSPAAARKKKDSMDRAASAKQASKAHARGVETRRAPRDSDDPDFVSIPDDNSLFDSMDDPDHMYHHSSPRMGDVARSGSSGRRSGGNGTSGRGGGGGGGDRSSPSANGPMSPRRQSSSRPGHPGSPGGPGMHSQDSDADFAFDPADPAVVPVLIRDSSLDDVMHSLSDE